MINFKLRSLESEMEGLNFEFAPPPFKNTHWNATSKYLAESAFSFIEGIIYYNVPNYQNFGHWGATQVTQQQWLLIKPQLFTLKQKVTKAQNFTELRDDLFDFAFIFDKTWQKEMSKNFLKYKLSFSQMISDLIIWIDENMQKYSSLYILGV